MSRAGRYAGELVALAALVPGEHVLDAGCGDGRTTVELARRVLPGGRVHAIEPDARLAAQATARAAALGLPVRVEVAALESLESLAGRAGEGFGDDARYDVVFASGVLHYLEDLGHLERGLRALGGQLRPGGRLLAVTGGAGNARRVLEACANAARRRGLPEPGWLLPTPAELEAAAREAGLVRVEVERRTEPVALDAERVRGLARSLARAALAAAPDPAPFLDEVAAEVVGGGDDTAPLVEERLVRLLLRAEAPRAGEPPEAACEP